MTFSSFYSNAGKYFKNLQGWRSKTKFVVFESDDWGSVRMPSREIYEKCLIAGYPVDKISYERYDSLLSQDDLELLFELLGDFRDINGNHPVFTANCVVANPDFERIKSGHSQNYYYEPITETFKKYPHHSRNFEIWLEGLERGVFFPQYHAREHLNVSKFMKALREEDKDAHWALLNHMPGSIPKGPKVMGNYYVEATRYDSLADKNEKLRIYLEGLDLFEKLFGYKSESIIPTNYTWSHDFNQPVYEKGVRYFQGNRTMREPMPGLKDKYHRNYLGKTNNLGQIYLVRNVIFEPSMLIKNYNDPVSKCLNDMSIAFAMNKPAIIGTHRLNYVGFIDVRNRDRNLQLLKEVIRTALKSWPDIQFITSCKLGESISGRV